MYKQYPYLYEGEDLKDERNSYLIFNYCFSLNMAL